MIAEMRAHGAAAAGHSMTSCLGLLTMISDYGARLGWRFEVHPNHSDSITVTTKAILPLKKILGECA